MAAETASLSEDVRGRLIAEPEVILEDRDLMRALIAANERAMGANIVDLRGVAMERLEARLDRLEDTHRSVIAAAYDNLAGTNQIHRAILKLLEPADFAEFLTNLTGDVAQILRVDAVLVVLESYEPGGSSGLGALGGVIEIVPHGAVGAYMGATPDAPPRDVVLRAIRTAAGRESLFGDKGAELRSEALMRLELGPGRLPAMLAFGAADPHQFRPSQGTDLLAFFGGVFQRALRRWLG